MIKPGLLPEADPREREEQRAVLLHVFETLLALGHPFLPFLTEEIWHLLPGERDSLLARAYPSVDPSIVEADVEERMGNLMEIVRAVRNIRSELNVPPAKRVEIRLKGQVEQMRFLRDHEGILLRLARGERVAYKNPGYIPVQDATAVVNDIEVCIPLAGLIDFGQEARRLGKEIEKAKAELSTVGAKLGNSKFVEHAPPDIVEAHRDRKTGLEEKIAKLSKNLELVSRYLA